MTEFLEHPRHKKIHFEPEKHIYTFEDGTNFSGVTTTIKQFQKPFNAKKQAKSSNGNPYSPWYRMGVENILRAWKEKGDHSRIVGDTIHDAIEMSIKETKRHPDMDYVQDMFHEKMEEHGIQPITAELVVFNENLRMASPIDVLGAKDNKFVVIDTKSYEDGLTTKTYNPFLPPIEHLDDSRFNYTSLQVSFYFDWLENPELYNLPMHKERYCYWNNGEDHELFPLLDLSDEVKLIQEFIQ